MSVSVPAVNTERTAKLFQSDGAQAVILPDEFRFEGEEVRIRRSGAGVLLEPVRRKRSEAEIAAWFAELDRLTELAGPAMPGGRDQPAMQEREWPL